MRILLINVALRKESPVKLFPVGLGYIATAIKNAGFTFDLFDIDINRYTDEQVNDFLKVNSYDVVLFGCLVTGYKIIKSLSLLIKKYNPNSLLIAGNSVASSIPEILLKNTMVDIAVMGEGDQTIIELLKCIQKDEDYKNIQGISYLEDNKLKINPERPRIKDISSLPFIDFSIWDIEKYITNAKNYLREPLPFNREEARALPVNTARGCIARCTFCYHIFKDVPYRSRSVDSIMNEISSLIEKYNVNFISLWDELTFFSKEHAREFAKAILDRKLKFYWFANCRADLFNDENDTEIIQMLLDAGCINMGYSLESASPEILKAMNKKITVEQFSYQTKLFQKVGLNVATSLVFGYPQETPETIKRTFDVCIENKIHPSVGFLLPQPGSVMYEYALSNGFIKNEEEYILSMADRQDLTLNMTNIPDEEFKKLVLDGARRCNEALNVGLEEDKLIKTQYYRAKK